jgi:spermidine synthase
MLSLVLGSSTHAFELMLSALILGIALGAYWVRRRIDGYQNLIVVLGVVLALKGILAIATLPLYDYTFHAMQGVVNALSKTEAAYSGFNLFSHAISMAIMVPSAFFAGMSLPIITTYLLKQQYGESAIGKVYAWNTVGAIVGVGIAVHIGLSVLGLRNLIIAAAVLDTAIAVALLWRGRATRPWLMPLATSVSVVALVGALVFVKFDALNMASGVFRDGKFYTADSAKVVFSKDGKTAIINVVSINDGMLTISTNGKTDAALQTRPGANPSSDEYTMVLAAALPLAYRPEAKHIANIGFGSGLTTHAVRGSPKVEVVDSIEIEPAMVEGARLFGNLVERAYKDARSNIVIDDAKSFFASRQQTYDIIISEPSNPWVSGVAGLFSREF